MKLLPIALRALLLSTLMTHSPAFADDAVPDAAMAASLDRIREAGLSDDWAYRRLADLCDKIGPRISGSRQADAAVEQIAAAFRASGLTISLQPVKVPHWVRGEEQAEIMDYPGRPEGVTQHLHLTTLGGSVATPAQGISGQVLVVHSFDELRAHEGQARGKIVLFDVPFDEVLAMNGRAGSAYGQGVVYRAQGAIAAARAGATAALVRSVGGANYRLPHTGQMNYDPKVPKIPSAALSAEDAMWVSRLAAEGPVTLRLKLTPQTLPEADSHNVIVDWPGRERPEEVVIVSGHLDSWDLAQGAIDDGAGVASAMGAVHLLQSLGLHARRTIRFVGWMSEENGSAGGQNYFKMNSATLARQIAAIESDNGAGRPLGVSAHMASAVLPQLIPLMKALTPMGASILDHRDEAAGSDVRFLDDAGVPTLSPIVDTRTYFDYHHTAADTLDKIDPDNIRRQVAVLAMIAYYLAEMPEALPRLPVSKPTPP
ncbi:MAG TPA: M20/M25/M40 family metallo-hydrolase [Steroidobacteraceae bacterium]